MKRLYIIVILIILSGFLDSPASETIKVNSIALINDKIAVKTEIKGHKVTLRSPKISKNKYLKLVNIVY